MLDLPLTALPPMIIDSFAGGGGAQGERRMISVIRADTGDLRIGDEWYSTRELLEVIDRRLTEAGSTNIGFDRPPFFRTGTPYGEALLALGCKPIKGPEKYRIAVVPHDGKKPWRSRKPIWPEVFNADQSLYEN